MTGQTVELNVLAVADGHAGTDDPVMQVIESILDVGNQTRRCEGGREKINDHNHLSKHLARRCVPFSLSAITAAAATKGED